MLRGNIIILRFIVTILAALAVGAPVPASTQEGSANDTAVLKEYFKPKSVTELDWQLMDFNIVWHQSFVGPVEHIQSHSMYFDRVKVLSLNSEAPMGRHVLLLNMKMEYCSILNESMKGNGGS